VPPAGCLERIVSETPWLWRALEAAREVDPPQWLIGSGAVRNAVWDYLHGYERPTELDDLDLVFFDPGDLSGANQRLYEQRLRAVAPDLAWEATNQAAVHLWYPQKFGLEIEPFRSAAEAVATWPETATAVALRLDAAGRVTIVAPHGLEDLLGLIHRRNPQLASQEEYERRLTSKRIAARWPRVTIVP
jgi:hypothetical protein